METAASPTVIEQITLYGLNVLAAFAILILGSWGAKMTAKTAEKFFRRQKIDETLVSFSKNLIQYSLMTFVLLAALGRLGVQTASFVAVIGAAGLAVGLALQGSLSNFAAGFLIILFRPFRVGDVIQTGGITGKVEEIQIFNTELLLGDGVRVFVPNSQITGNTIHNYTVLGRRRIDLTFGVSYRDDLQKVKKVLTEVVNSDSRVLKDPAPTIAVGALGDNSVNFVVRPWVSAADYWNVYFSLTEKIKEAFDKNAISIPFPQREVHVFQHPGDTAKAAASTF